MAPAAREKPSGTGAWSPAGPVRRTDAAGQVLDDLRHAIESGELAVGERLPSETAMAERYLVSRAVVREALSSLRALGLTDTRTGSGTFVVSRTARPALEFGAFTARDLVEARPHIEAPAAAWAATRRTQEQADEILRLCERMDAETGPREWVELDSEFHRRIAIASGNGVFAQIAAQVREALVAQSEIVNLFAHRREASNVEHRRIAQAILDGSGPDARAAMLDHLERVEAVVAQLLDAGDGDGERPKS